MKKIYYILTIIGLILVLAFALNYSEVEGSLLDSVFSLFSDSTEFTGNSFPDTINITSAQDPENNIFCVDEGTNVYPGTYEKSEFTGLDETQKNMIAYILSNGEPSENRNSAHPASYNVRQEAIWSVLNGPNEKGETYTSQATNEEVYKRCIGDDWWQGGEDGVTIITDEAPKFVKLYKEAEVYSEFVKNKTEFKVDIEKGEIQSSNSVDIHITGPYKVSFTSSDYLQGLNGEKTLTNGSLAVEISEENKNTGVWISTQSGDVRKIESGIDFYIAIDTSKVSIDITKESQISLKYIYNTYKLKDACKYIRVKDENGEDVSDESQELGSFDAEEATKEESLILEVPKLIPPVQVIINKVDVKGNKLDNKAIFKIEYSNGLEAETQTVSSDGEIVFKEITPTSVDNFTATITETSVAKGYKDLDKIELNIEYNNGKWKVTTTATNGVDLTVDDTSGKSKATLEIKNQPIIDKITLVKKDSVDGEFLSEVEFDVKITSGNAKFVFDSGSNGNILSGVTTNEQGEISLGALLIEDLDSDIIIEITEKFTPTGYLKLEAPIILTIKKVKDSIDSSTKDIKYKATLNYQNANYQVKDIDIDENNEFKIDIENIPTMNLGGIAWVDNINASKEGGKGNKKIFDDGEGLPGVIVKLYKDSISVDNLVNVNVYGNPLKKTTGKKGDTITYKNYEGEECTYTYEFDGQYVFPSVKKANYIVVFEYDGVKYGAVEANGIYENTKEWDDGKYKPSMKSKVTENEIERKSLTNLKNISGETILNIPSLSNNQEKSYGKATKNIDWKVLDFDVGFPLRYNNNLIDAESNLWNAEVTGIFDTMEDVKQWLREKMNEFLIWLTDEQVNTLIENIVTKYNEFLEESIDFNKIEEFVNEKIASWILSDEKKAQLINLLKNLYEKLRISAMVITAKSETYNFTTTDERPELETIQAKCYNDDWQETWNSDGKINDASYALDINCGIEERNLDLSIATDVQDATVEINGKSTTYTYDKILNDGGIDFGETPTDEKAVDYNLYLYESDYNYRISNYEEFIIGNNVNKEDINKIKDAITENAITEDDELQVYVRYKIVLNNQSSSPAQVTEIEDRFDNNIYEFVKATDKNGNLLVGINTKNVENGRIIINDNAISTELSGNSKSNTIYVIFKVKDIDNCKNAKNHVEITKYYTKDGFIDQDSAPGNAFVLYNNDDSIIHYEDDTDTANGITMQIKNNNPREISGNIWDDGKFVDADGTIDDSKEDKVNDVIVQLIEIKDVKINGKKHQFEYIWQEMKSGSNQVRKLNSTGTSIEDLASDVDEDGKYKFTGFIPGNYIVRFIYGDGTTYDLTDNVKKYNGKDYKSTLDPYYNEEWYNININNYNKDEKTDSVARDNEARRLKVMSYTTEVNSEKQLKLDLLYKKLEDLNLTERNTLKDVLKETWMCAETSKINILVDINESDKSSTKNVSGNLEGGETYDTNKFTNINFGLALRPIMELSLEKHITNLTLTSNDASATPIVDARLPYGESNIEGLKDGLTIFKSTRDNRGSWKIETDLEELAQGAQLQVIYNYIIKAGGEIEYISKITYNAYNEINNNGSTILNGVEYTSYEALLTDLEIFVKNQIQQKSFNKGTYLSKWYYTREEDDSKDTPISVTVTGIEEALNNDVLPVANILEDTSFEVTQTNANRIIWKSIPGEAIKSVNYIINNVVTNKTPTKTLIPIDYVSTTEEENIDSSKNIVLSTTLNSNAEGVNIPSYIAQITSYKTLGGVIKDSIPNNLTYVHSDDATRTLNYVPDTYDHTEKTNESDEFWGESIIITKPTGSDKLTVVQLIEIILASVAVLATGIILIKKFVIIKK